jgi:hypothetical protein
MTLPAAAQYTGTIAGQFFAGFSVPGIEIYEHDCNTGAPCEPCEIDEGDVCRPRWVNRQDHGYLTRVNIARASHPNAPYGCPPSGLMCGHPDLATTAFGPPPPGPEPEAGGGGFRPGPRPYSGAQELNGRRAQVNQMRQGAQDRQNAIAGAVEQVRARRSWGHHDNHNEYAGRQRDETPVGIRYIPIAGQPGLLTEDALIVAPGHRSIR